MNLKANKASQISDIPIKIVMDTIDIFSDFVCTSCTSPIKTSEFPGNLKLVGITPL